MPPRMSCLDVEVVVLAAAGLRTAFAAEIAEAVAATAF